jgi:thymidylate synthase
MVALAFQGDTLDDIMRSLLEEIMESGIQINPSKGECIELSGVSAEISNPRARFSRTETKGKPFSSLGELCWYLAKNNDLDFISYYLPNYKKYADGNILHGGYGPRLFNWKGINQVDQVISILRRKPDSRQAIIQLFDTTDIADEYNDVPCTCTIQLMIRNQRLQMITFMRSNDIFKGLPHDVFCFTMIQELIARSLSIEIGSYKHLVGSLHLYNSEKDTAKQFLDEGWQPTNISMPSMPQGDPWHAINMLLRAEEDLRLKGEFSPDLLNNLDSYWIDLIYLLQIFRYYKDGKAKEIINIRSLMSSKVYNSFIDKRLINTGPLKS